jgi:hypothetical protein
MPFLRGMSVLWTWTPLAKREACMGLAHRLLMATLEIPRSLLSLWEVIGVPLQRFSVSLPDFR